MAAKITPPLRLMLDMSAWQAETQIMTAAERGALLALKVFFWRTGALPDDDAVLARIVGIEMKDWKKARKAIAPLFVARHGEWMRQDWIDELEEAYAAVNRVKELSRKGNAARWGKRREAAESDPAGSPAGIPHEILNYKERTTPTTERQTAQPNPPKPRANDFQPDFEADVELAEAALGIGGAA
jgi:uncharacterized protein YdaU (DUF1376 family)